MSWVLSCRQMCLLLPALAFVNHAYAARTWTNSVSGDWQDRTNWLEYAAPDSTSSVIINNDLSKTILIDASTPTTNLTIQILTLSAPPGATNLVLLRNAGVTNPLTIQTRLEMKDGAALRVTNSALLLQLTNDHVNLDGSLTLDSGTIDFGDTTVTARVGRVTSGVLTINGGTGSLGAVTVGGLTNSLGAIYLNGGQLNLSSFLSIGRNPGTTGSVWVAGGQLNVPGDATKVGDGGIGQMTITNGTLVVTNLDVGHDDLAAGTLNLEGNGAVLLSGDLSVAVSGSATGAVWMAGGRITAPAQTIKVGRQGTGQFTMTSGVIQAASLQLCPELTPNNQASGVFNLSGGSLVLFSNLVVGTFTNSSGQALVSGGSLQVTNAGGAAILWVPNGSFTVRGGSVTVDNLLVTNSSGQLLFGAGYLSTRATTIQNGAPFVVGDGVSAAVLRLNGGTHVFAGGLTISSNATVIQCGTIIGTIINHGTLSTNCTALVQPRIARLSRSGTTNIIYFTTVLGQTYALEYKDHINDAAWTLLPGAAGGTGDVLSLTDLASGVAVRFYHVTTY